jgi:hypothetical protein
MIKSERYHRDSSEYHALHYWQVGLFRLCLYWWRRILHITTAEGLHRLYRTELLLLRLNFFLNLLPRWLRHLVAALSFEFWPHGRCCLKIVRLRKVQLFFLGLAVNRIKFVRQVPLKFVALTCPRVDAQSKVGLSINSFHFFNPIVWLEVETNLLRTVGFRHFVESQVYFLLARLFFLLFNFKVRGMRRMQSFLAGEVRSFARTILLSFFSTFYLLWSPVSRDIIQAFQLFILFYIKLRSLSKTLVLHPKHEGILLIIIERWCIFVHCPNNSVEIIIVFKI